MIEWKKLSEFPAPMGAPLLVGWTEADGSFAFAAASLMPGGWQASGVDCWSSGEGSAHAALDGKPEYWASADTPAARLADKTAADLLSALKTMTRYAREAATEAGPMHAFWDGIAEAEAIIGNAERGQA